MKSLGKQKVSTIHKTIHLDGSETAHGTKVETRVVYEKPDGTYCVNWLSSHKLAERQADGTFIVNAAAHEIKSSGAEALFRSLGVNFK